MHFQGESSGTGAADWMASLTYRSEAAAPLSPADLQALVAVARRRNHSSDVTGMLLYDGGRYLQTLEGPPEAVDRIWSSIKRDKRHTRIEVLSQHIVPSRLFSGWDLHLYDRRRGAVKPALVGGKTSATLADRVPAAARFALDGDDLKLNALIGDLIADGWSSDALVSELLEPAARALGDSWLEDACSEVDLTIALSMLQLAGHAIHARPCADSIRKSRYSVLLVTAPGEPHMLGPSLLGDAFNDAGWAVDLAFPDSDESLAKQLRTQRPDAVDIALSDALPRHYALQRLRESVESCRAASPDDVLVVSVGGRLFAEAEATARSVGADHARMSAVGTSVRLAKLIEQRRTRH